ncbi:hypothetical protein B0H14DRAFT_2602781 [Mycena olivaceomarginata]|nr:hypothetical protein B0H14DRAFT_2602781 [Mycena olivaceomarginata]
MSEITPKKISTQARGALVSGYQFAITIGILLANCVVQATQNGSTLQWRGRGAGRHWDRCCISGRIGSTSMLLASAYAEVDVDGLARQVSRAVGLGHGAVPGKPLNTGSFDMVIQDLACCMISNWVNSTRIQANTGEYVDQAEIWGNT